MTPRPGLRTAALATTALVAFAANSVLARLALGTGAIDPASYSTIRLASGALMLLALAGGQIGGSWPSAALLFLYAAPFSFAYVRLTTGTGALILFGAVQATMIAAGLGAGERPHAREWTGLAVALAGLVWLVFPGLGAPPFVAAALMASPASPGGSTRSGDAAAVPRCWPRPATSCAPPRWRWHSPPFRGRPPT